MKPINTLALLVVFFLTMPAPAASPEGRPRSLNDLTGPWQLLVDDHLIASSENVVRTYHAFDKHPANPVLVPDKPWEGTNVYLYGTVLPKESGKGYRMWYHALPGDSDYYRLLYAVSEDGVHWTKPDLGLVEYDGSTDNNIFIRRGKRDHIPSIIDTPWSTEPDRRYRMINFDGEAGGYVAAWSPDGLHWTDAAERPVFTKGGDVGQFLWDPLECQYLGYAKVLAYSDGMRRRAVGRIASNDITSWPDPELVLAPDTFDDRWATGVQRTHFYGLSAFPYESMYLGFLWIFRATDQEGYFDGPIFVELVTSRDGIHWLREEGDRPPILPLGPEGAWDDGMVFTATQPLVRDGRLLLYYGGFDCSHAAPPPWHGAIGLASLRKDGFASLDAGEQSGVILTRRMANTDDELRVNYIASPSGTLAVEVIGADGRVLPGYGAADCHPLTGDSIDATVTWKSHDALPSEVGPIRLRFLVRQTSLYSFMVGKAVEFMDEPGHVPLAALYTFESGWADALGTDGDQRLARHGDVRTDKEHVAFGHRSMRLGSQFSPWQTVEIAGTRSLGKAFTLAAMIRTSDSRRARLFSSFNDRGHPHFGDLVFECDPSGRCLDGLRLTCKGLSVDSQASSFDDGKYHHVAATYDDGLVALYLDGQQVGHKQIPGGAPVNLTSNLFLGEDTQLGREEQFRGHMDDVLVFGRALTPKQIAAIAHEGAQAFFNAHPALLQVSIPSVP